MILVINDSLKKKPVEDIIKYVQKAAGLEYRSVGRWKGLKGWVEMKGLKYPYVLRDAKRIKPVVGFWYKGDVMCHPDALRELYARRLRSEVGMMQRVVRREIVACEADLEVLEGRFKVGEG